MNTSKKLNGKVAFLRDIHCLSGQTGACKILMASPKIEGYVIVQWSADLPFHVGGR